jgi:hypothetical protein
MTAMMRIRFTTKHTKSKRWTERVGLQRDKHESKNVKGREQLLGMGVVRRITLKWVVKK